MATAVCDDGSIRVASNLRLYGEEVRCWVRLNTCVSFRIHVLDYPPSYEYGYGNIADIRAQSLGR